jgi:hypothetical protein
VALVVSPAEATTSATGSLTSGGNHLSTYDGSHLYTGGLPAMVATSTPVAYQRWWPPHRVQKGPHTRPPMGVRTRPSKNAATTSAAYGVLYNPLGGIRAGRPVAQGTPLMQQTCARRDYCPCGG